ncbi:MAG: hypothetical protein HFE30_04665 [Clostridiales bacterium]|nr:hypothetical protein [Clostridiales bacterium]
MLKLIIGAKGSGKTKTLIDLVNTALKNTNGSVVCIEKGDKLKFDISYHCRLMDTDQYKIANAESLYGFVAGILASNHDVSDLFIDSALKICENDQASFDEFLAKVSELVEKNGVNCVMTSSLHVENATAAEKQYL